MSKLETVLTSKTRKAGRKGRVISDRQPDMGPEKPSSTTQAGTRRSSKPLMEKKRRARINDCLLELKSLVLEATKRETARYSKLEKADILEMTVRHVRNIHRQYNAVSLSTDPSIVNKYRAGYNDCIKEVTKYINSADVESKLKLRLENHMSDCLSSITSVPGSSVVVQSPPMASAIPVQVGIPSVAQFPNNSVRPIKPFKTGGSVKTTDINNNVIKILPASVHTQAANIVNILPTSNGEFALVLPHNGIVTSPFSVLPVKFASSSSIIPTATVTSITQPSTSQHGASSSESCDQHIQNLVIKDSQKFEAEPEQVHVHQEQVPINETDTSEVWRPW